MAALCYPCKTKVATLSVAWATENDPVGCCKLCHVLACGLHGTRVASGPTFICVECQPEILAASAALLVSNKDHPNKDLDDLFGRIPKECLYKSFEDFLKKNPDFGKWVSGIEGSKINWEIWPLFDEFRSAFENAGIEATQLLIAAGLIIKSLYTEKFPGDYPEDLVLLSKSLDNNNLNTNDEREIQFA
jgi:hypothetical protein